MVWMKALRDHPFRPATAQCHVLYSLALRMDWETGAGFASAAQLAEDAACRERTVRNATAWARAAQMLTQTRRGHRLGDGRKLASEWQLCMPPQPAREDPFADASTGTGMPVEAVSTGKYRSLNRQIPQSQPARTAPPSELVPSRTSSSGRGETADAVRPPRTQPASPPPRRVPPCPECGKPFGPEDLTEPGDYEYAMRGTLLCLRCELSEQP
jgi:hypothetical protein